MRILYILDNYYPHIGGAELLFQQLAEGVTAAGHQVTILCPKNLDTYLDQEVHNGVQIVRQNVPKVGQRYFFTFLAIAKAIKLAKQHDIIHTATFNSIIPAWIAGKLTSTKAVLTVYEVWNQKWYSLSGQSWTMASIFRLLEWALLQFRFNQTICISDSTLRDYRKLFPSSKAQRIYPGVNYEGINEFVLTEGEKEAFRQTQNWSAMDYIVVSFGRPGISKGFDYLVDAIPTVINRLPQTKFIFIWPSAPNYISLRTDLVNRLTSFGLPNSVQVLDKQSQKDLFSYIQSADCVVIPSLAEGFGYAAIEACLLALRIVTTKAGSIPEVVSGNVYLAEPANSAALSEGIVSMFLQEPDSKPVKRFTNEVMIREHLLVYGQLLS